MSQILRLAIFYASHLVVVPLYHCKSHSCARTEFQFAPWSHVFHPSRDCCSCDRCLYFDITALSSLLDLMLSLDVLSPFCDFSNTMSPLDYYLTSLLASAMLQVQCGSLTDADLPRQSTHRSGEETPKSRRRRRSPNLSPPLSQK